MPGPITVSDLLDQVRDQLDESNTEDVTDSDILQAMNRGQRKAANILAKKWPDAFITPTTQTLTGGVDTYDIPVDSYGRRLEQVLCVRGELEYPLKRVSYRDLATYTSAATVSVPYVYALRGRQYTVKPKPAGGTVLKLWYIRAPETLVKPQGRITGVNVVSGYVVLDAIGDGLTTSVADLGAFVNIVDGATGEIKCTLQTLSLTSASRQVAFKSTGLTYPSVFGRTVAVAIPDTVEINDYVCAVQGTAVPDLPDACVDYLVQFAVYEVRRRMGEVVQDDANALVALEQQLERQWAGREASRTITNRARHWNW